MANEYEILLKRLFAEGDNQCPLGTFPLTHFTKTVSAHDYALLSASLSALLPDDSTVVVGFAERSVGVLIHLVSILRGKRYSLANWYPAGSLGDIEVDVSSAQAFAERGSVFVNGVRSGDRVVLIDDCVQDELPLRQLRDALEKHGIVVVGVVVVAEMVVGKSPLENFRSSGLAVRSLATVTVDGGAVALVAHPAPPHAPPPVPSTEAATLARLRTVDMAEVFNEVLRSFVGIPVTRGPTGYPYSNFPLTDFAHPFAPSLAEAIADAAVFVAEDLWPMVDVIVSESDRGGGPMCAALAMRTNRPVVMAGWNAESGGEVVAANVGYSGVGVIALRGIENGMRCLVVDDMLSSGGTCEALFRVIEAAGGIIQGAIFASEKVTTGGRGRLSKQWPHVPLLSLCYFASGETETVTSEPPATARDTPIQSCRQSERDSSSVDAPQPE